MSTRRVHEAPSFSLVENKDEIASIEKEIKKLRAPVEVSIEGISEVAKGYIADWNRDRKFFIVKWEKRSENFSEITNSKTGLRVFFKVRLFSTQIIFKTETVRRLEDGTFHYRIPQELYKQQRRGALRVPLKAGSVKLKSKEGTYELLDLSVGGAKLKTPKNAPRIGVFTGCSLDLMGMKVSTPEFQATLTYLDPQSIGVRFSGLNDECKTVMKQFLIDALRAYYEDL